MTKQKAIEQNWSQIKKLFSDSFYSSLHYAIASVNERGEPHVTPIGSLVLTTPGHGFYFEEFTQKLPQNLTVNQQICVLAVNSSKWYWVRSLCLGRFSHHPAIRLFGTAGQKRLATAQEKALWLKRVKKLRLSKGYRLMWNNMQQVRDIHFTHIEWVNLGPMTDALDGFSRNSN